MTARTGRGTGAGLVRDVLSRLTATGPNGGVVTHEWWHGTPTRLLLPR